MKIAGSIMIITFSTLIGILTANYKKSQINFIDNMIFLGEKVILLLSSTAPETNVIFKKLQADDRFKNTDLLNLYKNSPLPKKDNLAIKEFLDLIGKYDTETQIKYAQEFTGNFKTLKKQYQDYYNSHFKLYVISGLSVGIVICLMLI